MREFLKFRGLLRISEVYQLNIRTNTLVEHSEHIQKKKVFAKTFDEDNGILLPKLF